MSTQDDMDAAERRQHRKIALSLSAATSFGGNDALWFERAEAFADFIRGDEDRLYAVSSSLNAELTTEQMLDRASLILSFLENGPPRRAEAA